MAEPQHFQTLTLMHPILTIAFIFGEHLFKYVAHGHMHSPVILQRRHLHGREIQIPIALSGCHRCFPDPNRSSYVQIIVGLMHLHARKLSNHRQIEAIIWFSQLSCLCILHLVQM